MKRSCSPFRPTTNTSGQMPIYNRSYGHSRLANDEDDIPLPNVPKKVFLEKEVKTEDTLQSIALEFNVSVAELKRVNNIHKDNEIYARKVIKVPSNTLSLLLEKEYFTQPKEYVSDHPDKVNEDVIVDSVNKSSCAPRSSSDSSNSEEVIFSANAKYFFTPIKQTDVESLESQVLLSEAVPVETAGQRATSCNGADWGISWSTLLVLTLLLGIGGPLLCYLWYYLYKNHLKHDGS